MLPGTGRRIFTRDKVVKGNPNYELRKWLIRLLLINEVVFILDEIANDLREAITALNSALAKTPTKAIITRDEELNRFIVRIADEKSGEVVREIPSEAVLKFARNLQELKGLIFDKSL